MTKLDTDLGSIEAIHKRRAELEAEYLQLNNAWTMRGFEIIGELGMLAAEEEYLESLL